MKDTRSQKGTKKTSVAILAHSVWCNSHTRVNVGALAPTFTSGIYIYTQKFIEKTEKTREKINKNRKQIKKRRFAAQGDVPMEICCTGRFTNGDLLHTENPGFTTGLGCVIGYRCGTPMSHPHALRSLKQAAAATAASTHGQHTVNTRSTHGQHTVNTRSTQRSTRHQNIEKHMGFLLFLAI